MIYKRFSCSEGGTCNKKGPEKSCSKCGTHTERRKDGKYWYKFVWRGELIRESTKQGNDKVARNMESAHRTSLAKGEVGLRDKKPSISLTQFIDNRFEPWAKATFEKASPKTWFDWYRVGLRAIRAYKPLADSCLDKITSETLADFAADRQSKGLQVSTVNSSLRIARRVLRLAVEWGAADASPKVKLLSGERHRERVVTVARGSQVSERGARARRFDSSGSLRYGIATRGMLSPAMGSDYMGERSPRHTTGDSRQDCSIAARPPDDAASPKYSGNALGGRSEARRRLGLDCADS